MSSYTPPVGYVDGTPLNQTQVIQAEKSLNDFANQQIIDTDIPDQTLSGYNLQGGSLDIIRNSYSFLTCLVAGQSQIDDIPSQSYHTSTTKNNNQSASIEWQDISGSGVTITMPQNGEVIIHYYLHAYTPDNSVVAGNEGLGNGKWNNEVRLKVFTHSNNTDSIKSGTSTFCFEGTGGALDSKDPDAGDVQASYRSQMLTFRVNLTRGQYTFMATANPHSEAVLYTAKSTMVEAFYV